MKLFKALPTKIMPSGNKFVPTLYNKICRSESCWNVLKCSSLGNFKVHVDLLSTFLIEKELESKIFPSIEFYELYKWIKSSPYYTEKVEESCIRIPAIDLLSYGRVQKFENEIGEFIQNRSSWNDGLNNVVFNFHSPMSNITGKADTFENLPSGKSLIASSSLRHSTVRYGFDVPIPYYSKLVDKFSNSETITDVKRPLDMLILGNLRSDIQSVLDGFLESIQSSKFAILKLKNCDPLNNFDLREPICDQVHLNSMNLNTVSVVSNIQFDFEHEVKVVFTQSRYCLITFNEFDIFQNLYLSVALASGCVPIIVGMDHILPYETFIDWSLALDRIDIREIQFLQTFLEPNYSISDKRAQGTFLLKYTHQ